MTLFEFDIEGKKRGFHFNFMAFSYMEEATGMDLDDIIGKISSKGPKVKLLNQFFFAGAQNYCASKGLEVDFSLADVADWISEIGIQKSFEMIASAVGTKSPKNSVPHQ